MQNVFSGAICPGMNLSCQRSTRAGVLQVLGIRMQPTARRNAGLSRAQTRIGCLLVVWLSLLPGCLAGPLAGTAFPFESCVKQPGSSRYTVVLKNNTYDTRTNTSRVCFQLGILPADQCTPSGYRCCNTTVHKFKFYPDPVCRRAASELTYQVRNGPPVKMDALYYEGADTKYIGKVTTLPFNMTNSDTGVLCWTLKAPCATLYDFTHPATRDRGLFEIALYDFKINNYECCPLAAVPNGLPVPPGVSLAPLTPMDPPSSPYTAVPDMPTPPDEPPPPNQPPPSQPPPNPPPPPKPPPPKAPSPKPPSPRPPPLRSPPPPPPSPPPPSPPPPSPPPPSPPPPSPPPPSPPPPSPPPSSPYPPQPSPLTSPPPLVPQTPPLAPSNPAARAPLSPASPNLSLPPPLSIPSPSRSPGPPSSSPVPAFAVPSLSVSQGSALFNLFLAPDEAGPSFDAARARCGRGGGTLASFLNEEEYTDVWTQILASQFMDDYYGEQRLLLWIGVDPSSSGGRWLDGSQTGGYWPAGSEPLQAGTCYALNCAASSSCTLVATDCDSWAPRGFLCKTNTDVVSYVYGSATLSKTFIFSSYGLIKNSAATYCGSLGGHLVSMNTKAKFNEVIKHVTSGSVAVPSDYLTNNRTRFWLGIANTAATKWVDGTAVVYQRFTKRGPPGCYVLNCPAGPSATVAAAARAPFAPSACRWELASSCIRPQLFLCEVPGVYEGASGPVGV